MHKLGWYHTLRFIRTVHFDPWPSSLVQNTASNWCIVPKHPLGPSTLDPTLLFDPIWPRILICKKYPKWRGTDFQQSGKSNKSYRSQSTISNVTVSSRNSIWPENEHGRFKGVKDTWCVMRFEYFSFMNLIQFLVLITGKFFRGVSFKMVESQRNLYRFPYVHKLWILMLSNHLLS